MILTARLGSGPDDPGPVAHRIARAQGLRLLGPDSAGLAVPGAKLNASLFAHAPAAGDLALVSQSGTVAAAIVEWGARHGTGFSAVLSLGSVLDIGVADCLDHFAADYRTRAILLCLDRVGGCPPLHVGGPRGRPRQARGGPARRAPPARHARGR